MFNRKPAKIYPQAYIDGLDEVRAAALNKAVHSTDPHKQDGFYDVATIIQRRIVQIRKDNKAALTRKSVQPGVIQLS